MLPTLVSVVGVSAAVVAPHTSGMTGPMWRPAVPPDALRLLAVHPQPLPVMPALCVRAGCGVRLRGAAAAPARSRLAARALGELDRRPGQHPGGDRAPGSAATA